MIPQGLALVGLVVGLAYLVVRSADSWADWVVFGVLVLTAFRAALTAQTVLTTSTEHDALCVTVFGTLPSTRRSMPLLPTTSRSAP